MLGFLMPADIIRLHAASEDRFLLGDNVPIAHDPVLGRTDGPPELIGLGRDPASLLQASFQKLAQAAARTVIGRLTRERSLFHPIPRRAVAQSQGEFPPVAGRVLEDA